MALPLSALQIEHSLITLDYSLDEILIQSLRSDRLSITHTDSKVSYELN